MTPLGAIEGGRLDMTSINDYPNCRGTGVCIDCEHINGNSGDNPWVWRCTCSYASDIVDDNHAARWVEEVTGRHVVKALVDDMGYDHFPPFLAEYADEDEIRIIHEELGRAIRTGKGPSSVANEVEGGVAPKPQQPQLWTGE